MLAPNAISYNAGISACAMGAQWDKALTLLWKMPERRFGPDATSYYAVISACEKGAQLFDRFWCGMLCVKKWEKALALLLKMPERRLEPNVIC